MTEVTIGIPTFRRPKGLARLLASLAELKTEISVTVLVGDNDAADHQGANLCSALRDAGYRWPLEAIVVKERGIACNRNALVARALENPRMQFLAMLDDDEWVLPDWLDALLHAQAAFAADAVEGPVTGVFEGTKRAQKYYGVADHRGASQAVDELVGAGNLLVARGILERMALPYFDPKFALSGGEDKDFFVRLRVMGARFAWSADAQAFTTVPASRATLKWTLARAYGSGNSDMRIFLKHRTNAISLAREIVKIAGALLLSPVAALILVLDPNRRMAALRKFFRAAGKTAALFGSQYQEYSVIHGE